MTKDMTTGSPLKLILSFAFPLLLGNLLQQTYNLIDATIVGRYLGSGSLASIGASTSVQFFILGFCTGTCSGFTIPIARTFGAGDLKKMRSYIFQSAFLTALLGLVMTVACAILCPWILHMLAVPDDIFRGAYHYLVIIFLGIPFTLLYNLLAGILRAVGDSKTPFRFLTLSIIINIVLDLLCVLVLNWGCAGAAIATVASQTISGLGCLWFISGNFEILHLKKSDRMIQKEDVLHLLSMGIPMGIQFSITAIGSMIMQAANNGLGSIYVSGFTAGTRIKQFVICPFDAIGSGVSVFISQNLGAFQYDRIRKGLLDGCAISILYGILAGLLTIFGGRTLSLLLIPASDTAVLDASAKYLFCMGFFFWIRGLLNTSRMSIQGIGYPGRAVVSGILEMIARIVVALGFTAAYGYTAICFADQAAWCFATLYNIPMAFYCIRNVMKAARPANE